MGYGNTAVGGEKVNLGDYQVDKNLVNQVEDGEDTVVNSWKV